MMDRIHRLTQVVFEDENHLLESFNRALHKGEYNKARCITESLREIKGDIPELLELDTIVTDLCIEQEDNR